MIKLSSLVIMMKNNLCLWILVFTLFSCQERDEKVMAVDQCRTEELDILCTNNLLFVPVLIIDQDSMPVALDRYLVTDHDEYHKETFPNDYSRQHGQYVLLTDTESDIIAVGGSLFTFSGFVGNKEVVRKSFMVGYNCCHVFMMDDNYAIINL